MTTDPRPGGPRPRIDDDGFDAGTEWRKLYESRNTRYCMSDADTINMLIEQLTAAWGSVAIACDSLGCQVSDGIVSRVFEAPTLLEALRTAAEKEAT